MKTTPAFLALLLIVAAVEAADLPGNSFANFSGPVRKDLEKNIKQYLREKHGCKKFVVKDTRGLKEEGDVLVDGKKRLFGGVISEKWDIVACDKPLSLLIVISPDGAGGTIVAIASK